MPRPLASYASKRSFTKTPEPAPKLAADRRGPLLFVIQKHAARALHYDFRLEVDGVLKSWAVPKGLSLDTKVKHVAIETEDHPFDYGSFEGVIPPKQYGAGNVIVWDCGVYSPDEDQRYSFGDREEAEARVRAGLEKGKLSIFLRGHKLKGSFALVRMKDDKQWLVIKHKDRFVSQVDVLNQAQSVLSGLTVTEMSADKTPQRIDAAMLTPYGPHERMPKTLEPMLAEVGEEARSDPNELYEPKLDGYRCVAILNRGEVQLISRGGLDLRQPFPEVTRELEDQAVDTMILDGEIVALSASGQHSFNALQKRAQLKTAQEIAAAQRDTPVAYITFDILHFAGLDLRDAVYADRRRYLEQCLLPSPHVQLVHVSDVAEQLYAVALEHGFEGIMAKRKNSTYQPGRRSGAWRKIKAVHTSEFVIGGYTRGKGARDALGSLLLGEWQGDALQYVGHAGSGLSDQLVKDLRKKFVALERKTPPFASKPPLHRPTTWLAPELVAEVSYSVRTPSGFLRDPRILRLRDDVASQDVKAVAVESEHRPKPRRDAHNEIEDVVAQLNTKAAQLDLRVAETRIRLTNLNREYWPADPRTKTPAITKRDLIRYLAQVSPFMLPHLEDRPLTMIRMPDGIHGERFFQKRWEQVLPEFVDTVPVFSDHNERAVDCLLANNLPTLLWLGQVGTLEFHVWHSRAHIDPDASSKSTDYASSLEALESSVLNYPDYVVFDIDPYIYSGKEPKGAEPEFNKKGFAVGKKVAFWLRALLEDMSLDAVVKTSGKTGLHIYLPIERTLTFTEARHVCEMVGRHLMQQHPREITMEWAVVKRTGKIFMDYNMNVRGKTLNAAYSPRGVPGAPISMPLTWEELENADPSQFTLHNALSRLEKSGDRWHDALDRKYNLAQIFANSARPES